MAVAAWLLTSQRSSAKDDSLHWVAALLLVAGVAGALSFSALFAGLVAGVFWRFVGHPARDAIAGGVQFVQHPLLVVVLLVAGARVEATGATLVLAAAYAMARTAGKFLSHIARRALVEDRSRHDLERDLLPGVFGIALALNARTMFDAAAVPLLASVAVGTIGAELIALAVASRASR